MDFDISIPIGSSSSKRKRNSYEDDSDDEVASYGKQILPVAALPYNFDGEPQDGLEYLFTVRRDAQRLPGITRVPNPYEGQNPLPDAVVLNGNHPSLPSKEWCDLLETRFKNLRTNLNQPTIFVGPTHEPNRRYMPDKKERDLWWAYLEGKAESEWNVPKNSKRQQKRQQHHQRKDAGMRAWADEPEEMVVPEMIIYESALLNDDEGEVEEALSIDPAEGLPTPSGTPGPSTESPPRLGQSSTATPTGPPRPREPSTTLLKLIDEPTALHLLMYFTHWMNTHVQNPEADIFPQREHHARWIFALLSRVDDYVSPDDMNLLRNVARACLALLKLLIEQRIMPRIGSSRSATIEDRMTERSCWILIAIIVHVWKQRDLWMDAESILSQFPVAIWS
ncbi:hypothetical protein FA15DRAFT_664999 [Coprinopsis marcescibilis]|uniref:Uncharacterized protein n=1 Tax=Coprinopsis marcescibilis TaxID=230819 RepID=A0A5C3L7A9_COPMA|nr:hypothetical protein FA15DRAFT_664999 [Coprinopsis marcescibilis]